jgi:hypothetical protein
LQQQHGIDWVLMARVHCHVARIQT